MLSSLSSSYDWLVSSVVQSLPAHRPPPPAQHCPIGKMSCKCLRVLQDYAIWTRAAGLSGALSVGMGAYGAHVLREKTEVSQQRKYAFETGNRYHLIHSVALLASPMSKHPAITAGLFLSGMLLFSGTCYHYGLTGKEDFRRFTPVGGLLLIAAWLSIVL